MSDYKFQTMMFSEPEPAPDYLKKWLTIKILSGKDFIHTTQNHNNTCGPMVVAKDIDGDWSLICITCLDGWYSEEVSFDDQDVDWERLWEDQ